MDNDLLEEIEALNRHRFDVYADEIDEIEGRMTIPVEEIGMFVNHLLGDRMLDVGCGWGRYVSHFMHYGLSYTGVDFSPRMVAEARKRNPDAHFSEMSFRSLKYADGSFDGIWSCCALQYEPKRNINAVLAEMHRVLVKDGIFALILPSFGKSEECAADDEHPFVSEWTAAEIKQHLEHAGFQILREENDTTYACVMFFILKKK